MDEENKEEDINTEFLTEDLKKVIESKLKQFTTNDITTTNLDILYKLVDIHKDLENEDYWKVKKEVMNMRYGNYGEYSDGGYGRRGRYGRGSGRYSAGYGHYPMELMEEMKEQYMDYSEGKEQYNRSGSYNGEEQMVQATEAIMKNITEIVKELSQTDNPQVMKIIQKNAKKIMDM